MSTNTKGPGQRTLKFVRSMMANNPKLPHHLWPAALHEAGHAIVAICFGVLPPLAKLEVNDQGWGRGVCAYDRDPMFECLQPREQATIHVAGAVAAAGWLDADFPVCQPSAGDLANLKSCGVRAPEVWNTARDLITAHKQAVIRFTIALGIARELDGEAICHLLNTHPDLATVSRVGGEKRVNALRM